MAVVVVGLDEEVGVAVARALVEAPHCALVAAADPNSSAGYLAMADTYEEALEHARTLVDKGWRVAVWEIPLKR
jgi:dihydrodipicolinate reductase